MATLTSSGTKALDDFVARTVEEKKIPGFVFGVANLNDEIYLKSGGFRVLNNPSSGEVKPDSVLWICSQTKLIAHLAGLHLIEQGKLSFEDPVSKYLPEFANLVVLDDAMAGAKSTFKPAKNVALMKHLFNHSSGLVYPFDAEGMYNQREPYAGAHDSKDPVAHFWKIGNFPGIPLQYEPGTNFAYGYSSDALGFVVEKVSGQSLEAYCKEHIFNPLGMKSSFYLTPELEAKAMDMTFRRDGKLEAWANQSNLIERDPTKVLRLLGGVGLYSSMQDYLTLLQHLLQINAGTAKNPILKLESVQSLFQPTLTDAGAQTLGSVLQLLGARPGQCQWSTALALCLDDWPGRRRKGSAYWAGWAATYGHMDPATGIAAVFGTQVIPTADAEVFKVYTEFEEILYASLQ